MTANLNPEPEYCIHCGQVGISPETLVCPGTRTTYKIDQGFGDWPGPHIMRRVGGSDEWVALPVSDLSTAEDGPPAA